MLLKLITVKNVLSATIHFQIMGSNFNILYVMVVDLMMLCFNITDIAITTVKGVG